MAIARLRCGLHFGTAPVLIDRDPGRRPELDKRGNDRTQPLPHQAVRAFQIALGWRNRSGYTGRFVFFPVQDRRGDRPWTYAALSAALNSAEERAGVAHVRFRGMHGFRRGACRNVLELTGELNKAGEWIGDTDLRTLKKSYSVADKVKMPTEKREAVATEW